MNRFVLRTTAKGVCIECLLTTMITLVLIAPAGKVSAQSIITDGQVQTGSLFLTPGPQPSPLSGGVRFTVGSNRPDSVIVSDGGQIFLELDFQGIETMTSTIGRVAGGVGQVTISGQGSVFHSGNFLTIGDRGNGSLTVEAGGSVVSDGPASTGESTFSTIGARAGGIGTVNVRGIGSSWSTGALLTIGDAGTGTLNISDGGSVTAGDFSSIGRKAVLAQFW